MNIFLLVIGFMFILSLIGKAAWLISGNIPQRTNETVVFDAAIEVLYLIWITYLLGAL